MVHAAVHLTAHLRARSVSDPGLEDLRKELNAFRRRVLQLLRFVGPQNDALEQFITVTQKQVPYPKFFP